jgi:hypothetical protein
MNSIPSAHFSSLHLNSIENTITYTNDGRNHVTIDNDDSFTPRERNAQNPNAPAGTGYKDEDFETLNTQFNKIITEKIPTESHAGPMVTAYNRIMNMVDAMKADVVPDNLKTLTNDFVWGITKGENQFTIQA